MTFGEAKPAKGLENLGLQGVVNDAGAGLIVGANGSGMIVKVSDRIVGLKAIRRLCAQLDISFGVKELDALMIVDTWCMLNRRESGPISSMVGWSGYTKNWKAKVYQGIRECLQIGALEAVKTNGGESLSIAPKGRRIMSMYDACEKQVLEEYNQLLARTDRELAAKAEKKRVKALARELAKGNKI